MSTSSYRHILVVINALTDEKMHSIQERVAECSAESTKLSLLHTVPKIPACYFQLPSAVMLTKHLLSEARANLLKLGKVLGVGESRQLTRTSPNKMDIMALAQELSADVIMTAEGPDDGQPNWGAKSITVHPVG